MNKQHARTRRSGSAGSKSGNGLSVNGSFAASYLSYLLSRASHIVASGFHKKLKTWKLTVPEYRVLACLTGAEGLGVGDLAAMDEMLASPSPEILALMQKHGVIPPLTVYVEA